MRGNPKTVSELLSATHEPCRAAGNCIHLPLYEKYFRNDDSPEILTIAGKLNLAPMLVRILLFEGFVAGLKAAEHGETLPQLEVSKDAAN
jgi:hypothetical protein